MPRKSKEAAKDGETAQNEQSTCCSWLSSDDPTLVRVLREQKENGNQSGNGWKPQVWQAAADALKAEGTSDGPPKIAKKCADHWGNLKKNFGEVQAIRNASGFGWDEGTKTCTASPDVWEKYIAAHPSANRWRTTTFPLFDDIHFLVNGIVATGAGAFHPGRSISPTATESSSSDSVHAESLDVSATSQGSEETQSSSSSTGILHDSLSEDIMDSSDNPRPVTPAPMSRAAVSRKRTRADSDPPSPDTSASAMQKSKGSKRHRTQADSLLNGVAGAILQLSKSLNSGTGIPTPERCEKAIDLLTEDKAFSLEEEGDLLELFAENVAYADTYLATKKKESRVLFGRKIIKRCKREADEFEN
ncbi:hypothetical protein H0H81_006172 [Sphagnurus paluster]|uniref:Myb/SANT-like domain-containing protein n=1 Tax=Sphagnurus paluster TaxID=117069 RepID=A0A9P7GRH5_9AGAR|nr:hypothetical protein H0H81_006172 [Sphagnurus paluster]